MKRRVNDSATVALGVLKLVFVDDGFSFFIILEDLLMLGDDLG